MDGEDARIAHQILPDQFQTDAAAGARYQRDLSVEIECVVLCHASPPCLRSAIGDEGSVVDRFQM